MVEIEQDDQQQGFPFPNYAGQPYQHPINQFSGSIVLLTNPQNELHKLELTLRGLMEDAEGKMVVSGEELLNAKGVASVLGMIQSVVSQITIMSNFKDQDISKLIMLLGDTMNKDLMLNREYYEIKNASSRDKIIMVCMQNAYITLKRGLDEGDRRFWKGSTQEITQRFAGEQSKSKGFLSGLANAWKG
jgi:uncharacterized protein YkvS